MEEEFKKRLADYFTSPELIDLLDIPVEELIELVAEYIEDKHEEYTPDAPEKIKGGAIKYDGGKAPIYRGALSYFPRAIELVAAVSLFGATKYAWKGWESVDDGVNRYSDALVRHLASEGKGEVVDTDSGLLHAGHAAWNALARCELILRDMEKEGWFNDKTT